MPVWTRPRRPHDPHTRHTLLPHVLQGPLSKQERVPRGAASQHNASRSIVARGIFRRPVSEDLKKIVDQETSSESSEEEEEVKPKKKSGNRHTTPEQELVNQKSDEDIKQELHNQKLKSALRSLGYID